MNSIFQRLVDLVLIGVVLILLVPAVMHVVGQALVPIAVLAGLVCLIRIVWFYTSL